MCLFQPFHIQLCKLVSTSPKQEYKRTGQLEPQSIWCHPPWLQGRAGSDSGPCCGKKQALIPSRTLSATAPTMLHTCKILSLTQGQQEPWSSPSSRPVLVTPYKQIAAQIPPQPLQPIPQSIVCSMGQPRLQSLDKQTLVPLVLNITRTQEHSFPSTSSPDRMAPSSGPHPSAPPPPSLAASQPDSCPP